MEQSINDIGWFSLTLFVLVGTGFTIAGIGMLIGRYLGGITSLCFGLIALLVSIPEVLNRWGIHVEVDDGAIWGLILMAIAGTFLIFLLSALGVAIGKKTKSIIRVCLSLLIILSVLVIIDGFVRVADVVVGLFPSVITTTFLRDALRLEIWEMPALYFYLGITLPITVYVLSKVSGSGYHERFGDGELTLEFSGAKWGLGDVSKWFGVIVLSVGTLYCWAQCIDIILGTHLTSAFNWVDSVYHGIETLTTGLGFFWEILVFVFIVGALIFYAVSKQQIGCLLFTVAGFAVWLWWAFSSGFLDQIRLHIDKLLDLF
jgi:uncharacterized membrane protein